MGRKADDRAFVGRSVLVMGLGRFGGGVGAARFLAAQGARVLVTDLADHADLADSIEPLRDLIDAGAVALRLGGHDERDFASADLVVASPAVPRPWDNRFLRVARESAAEITTEIALLMERLPRRERVIGVTGTAGKSTTAAMIAHVLKRVTHRPLTPALSPKGRGGQGQSLTGIEMEEECPSPPAPLSAGEGGSVFFGGNIGGSLLGRLHEITSDDWVVLELSSAQLHWLGSLRARGGFPPRVAVVTNLAPNHLDWHGSFEQYAQSKSAIARGQEPGDALLLGPGVADQRAFMESLEPASGAIEQIVDPVPPAPALPVPGGHNRLNAAIALRAVERALGLEAGALDASLLADFPGLPHRLQVAARSGAGLDAIRAVNDSKSTTPEATALAIAAFDEPGEVGASRVRLICGGYDKGVDLTPMIAAATRCAGVYTIGATGPAIAAAVEAAGGQAADCSDLDGAMARAARGIQPGEVLLLSPGCASWDQFRNFEARGDRFTALARRCFQKSTEQT